MAKRGGFPGGAMPGNMANLMKQAQKMQRQMEEQAKEMETKVGAVINIGADTTTVALYNKGIIVILSCFLSF